MGQWVDFYICANFSVFHITERKKFKKFSSKIENWEPKRTVQHLPIDSQGF